MANNNWNVASKVRKNITFAKLPIIGDYVDVKFRMVDLITFSFGGMASWQLYQYFPSNQIPQAILVVLVTLVMTIYLVIRDGSNPEKSNFDLMKATLLKKRKKHYKMLTKEDLEM